MRRILHAVGLTLLTLASPATTVAAEAWSDGSRVHLEISAEFLSQPVEYDFEMFSDGDARITEVNRSTPAETSPVIILVSGQVMLLRGVEPEEGYEIDILDGPVLMLQLAFALLESGVTEGPDGLTIGQDRKVQREEPIEPIEVSTTSAGGSFPAPWRLSGTVGKDEGGKVTYSLDFFYTSEIGETAVRITGTWIEQTPRPQLDPEMELRGWKSYRIGPITRTSEGSTIYDFGATPTAFEARTVAELKAEISRP